MNTRQSQHDCENCANRGNAEKCAIARGHAPDSNAALTCENLYPQNFARLCKDCPPHTRAICRNVFGKFHEDKSWGGVGCRHHIDDYVQKHHQEIPPPPPME